MSTFKHILIISAAVFGALGIMLIPSLRPFALQAFALAAAGYLIVKRFNKSKVWYLIPEESSAELAIITFAFLIIVSATGNLHSPLYPLTFVHLFLLVMAAESETAIVTALEIALFHYSLSPFMTPLELSNLLSIPLVLLFFLFAKIQYGMATKEKSKLVKKQRQIEYYQDYISDQELQMSSLSEEYENEVFAADNLKVFLQQYISPRLEQIKQLNRSGHSQLAISSLILQVQQRISTVLKTLPTNQESPAETHEEP